MTTYDGLEHRSQRLENTYVKPVQQWKTPAFGGKNQQQVPDVGTPRTGFRKIHIGGQGFQNTYPKANCTRSHRNLSASAVSYMSSASLAALGNGHMRARAFVYTCVRTRNRGERESTDLSHWNPALQRRNVGKRQGALLTNSELKRSGWGKNTA